MPSGGFMKKIKLLTVGSDRNQPRSYIKKTVPAKVRPVSNTYGWGEFMKKFWGYVSQDPWEILALEVPKLAQMAKSVSTGLDSKTRPLFHTVSVTEYEFQIKIPKNGS